MGLNKLNLSYCSVTPKRFTVWGESRCGLVCCLCRVCSIWSLVEAEESSKQIRPMALSSLWIPQKVRKPRESTSPLGQQYPFEENSFLIPALKKLFEINVKTTCHFSYKER